MMTNDQKNTLPVRVAQNNITPANRRIMAYSMAIVVMLCGVIILTSFNL
jgi:hypothetical protein